MRRLVAVVLLVVVGCSSATAETTSTAGGQAAQVTTTTVGSTTTTTALTTSMTADSDACPPEGGGQTSRGLFCPPDLPQLDPTSTLEVVPMMPGTYRTRIFQQPLEFMNPNRFSVQGETTFFVDLDIQGSSPRKGWIQIGGEEGVEAEQGANLAAHDCAVDPVVGEAVIGGYTADTVTASLTCDIPLLIPGDPLIYKLFSGIRVRYYFVPLPDRTISVRMEADIALFDSYLAERGQAVIDSIRFLDQ